MMGQAFPLVAASLLAVLSACGPIPVDQAERVCLRDAELARAPQTDMSVGIGTGSGGTQSFGRINMQISGDYIAGRDPADVFDRCVMRRSGQMPQRVLGEQLGWQGRV
jgi:hypothetical protein